MFVAVTQHTSTKFINECYMIPTYTQSSGNKILYLTYVFVHVFKLCILLPDVVP